MKVGYARISTFDQNLALQLDALKQAGCERLFQDVVSGSKAERQGLKDALDFMREGDCLVVWRLDRLGRSLSHLITLIGDLEKRKITFHSLQESIETSTSGGKLIFHVFGALAEFERNLIRERTMAGLQAARARGRKGGRPLSLDAKKLQLLYRLYDEKQHTVIELCQMLAISKTTLYAYLNKRK